ncbi:hypothetical protein ABS71_10485 [bacterium SCN 62-11]|nr:MAG: hypothetical protein ABS71_10485 [bacterium SCN 62-11]
MICPTCRGSAREEIVRSSHDGVTWTTKTFLRCVSRRMSKPCPVLVAVEGEEPTLIQPGPVRLPQRRLTISEINNLKGNPDL